MQSQVKRRIAFGITTGGLLAGGGFGVAQADTAGSNTGTTASGSPGILSGNTVQIPVDIPINVCGVTANVLGLLNPAAHNECSNSGSALASGGTTAADGSTATGGTTGGSPGILSGNNVQIPVHIPVNACGDTVNVVGVGDAAKHNECANHGSAVANGGSGTGGTTGGSGTGGTTGGSSGVLSGNNVQVPIDIPVNVCGDSVSVVGVGDVAKGNDCANHGSAIATPPSTPPATPPSTPPSTPPPPHTTGTTPGTQVPPGATGSLAHTGADGLLLAPIGAAMIGGGAFLYRKFKPNGTH